MMDAGQMMLNIVRSCIGTKFTSRFGTLIADLAIDAVSTIAIDLGNGQHEVDIKKYSKVEKIPGGRLEDSKVLKGVMFNKDVVSPGKMRRRILNPRIILLDSPLEYKKGENMTNAELMKEDDWYDTEHYNSFWFVSYFTATLSQGYVLIKDRSIMERCTVSHFDVCFSTSKCLTILEMCNMLSL
jgi:hypothetical protein